METISQNAKLAKRYLEEIYDKINLPPEEAEGDLFWRLLFLAAKSEDQFGKLINLNGQFMEYVEQHHGISVPALGGAEPVMPGIGQRMDRSGALPQGFCTRLLENLLEQVENQTPLAGVALGLLAILRMGLRSREALALSLGELCREICRVKLSQGKGTSRKIPVVSLLQEAANRRVQTLCRQLGISREKALDYPVTGAEQDAARMMEQKDFAEQARKIFLALGMQEEALKAYSSLLEEMGDSVGDQEVSVCAYMLRRDYITRLYNHTALPERMIRYLAGHAQADQKPYLPNDAELAAARLALEQTFPGTPSADGAAPVTVCRSAHTLAPGEILQITAAECGAPMTLTVTGQPGTAVDVVLTQRCDPPDDAPVWRNMIHE